MRTSLIEWARTMENEIVRPLYKYLLKSGWTLGQIDEMDIHFYFNLDSEETEKVYIDQIKLF